MIGQDDSSGGPALAMLGSGEYELSGGRGMRVGPPGGYVYPMLKRGLDIAVAFLILIPAAPVMLLAMLLVKLTSPGPAIYTQQRIGLRGRVYTIYKIRSMHYRCEDSSGPQWSRPGSDDRVTPIGRLLRAYHVDELPQLFNVLLGDMSLVGPRPERPVFVEQLEQAVPRYADRHELRPGLTGLAQVQLPPDSDLKSVRRKLACDLYYVEHMSLGMDLRILLGTVNYVMGIPFWVSKVMFKVPSEEHVAPFYRQISETDATGTTILPA